MNGERQMPGEELGSEAALFVTSLGPQVGVCDIGSTWEVARNQPAHLPDIAASGEPDNSNVLLQFEFGRYGTTIDGAYGMAWADIQIAQRRTQATADNFVLTAMIDGQDTLVWPMSYAFCLI